MTQPVFVPWMGEVPVAPGSPVALDENWRDRCPHGKPSWCVYCRTGEEDHVEALVVDARMQLCDEPAAAVVAEALIRSQEMSYLDRLCPEEAGRLAVKALGEAGLLRPPIFDKARP